MIANTLSLVGSLYDAIGPGLILAAALPVFLVAEVLVLRAARMKWSEQR
jgi:hypothetical protein